MSAFPDFLFKLTPRDEQTVPIESVNFFDGDGASAGGNTIISATYTVPKGKVLIMQSMGAMAQPAAAGNFSTLNVVTQDPNGNALILWGVTSPSAGNTIGNQYYSTNPSIILTEGQQVNCIFRFLAVGNHFSTFCMTGILIPRGNIAI